MPGVVVIIPGLEQKAVLKLKKIIDDPQPTLRKFATILLGQGQRAFIQQRLGDIRWPKRYPKQGFPPINVAGVVADFLAGRTTPPDRRFKDRPAGIDTRLTARSLTPGKAMTIQGYVLTLKSNTPGAQRMAHGGVSKLPVTDGVKSALGNWLKRLRNQVKKFGDKPGIVIETRKKRKKKGFFGKLFGAKEEVVKFKTKSRAEAALKLGAASKLVFLFHQSSLRTKVNPRPFFGVTDESLNKMMAVVSDKFLPPGIRGRKT